MAEINSVDEIKSYSPIVIDEVGRYSERERESCYLNAIIDEHYNKDFSVMTSNLDKQKLAEHLGVACVDQKVIQG